MLGADCRQAVGGLSICRGGCFRAGLDCNFDFGARLQANFFPVLICQSVLDAHLAIEVIGTVDSDLGTFGFRGKKQA